MIRVLSVAVLLLCVGSQTMTPAQTDPQRRLEDEAATRVQEYLRVNTVNPPGNESRGVEYLAGLLKAEGIPYETVESAPGRGSIWARLDGGPEPAALPSAWLSGGDGTLQATPTPEGQRRALSASTMAKPDSALRFEAQGLAWWNCVRCESSLRDDVHAHD